MADDLVEKQDDVEARAKAPKVDSKPSSLSFEDVMERALRNPNVANFDGHPTGFSIEGKYIERQADGSYLADGEPFAPGDTLSFGE